MAYKRWFLSLIFVLILALVTGASAMQAEPVGEEASQAPLGTAFTYQGSLSDGGSPANGTYDFTFALFTTLSGGSATSTLSKNGVVVTNGLFTVELDFGSAFDGSAYYLEVAVSPAGAGTFTTLTPRQALTPAPYANYALKAGTAATADTATTAGTAATANSAPWSGLTGVPAGFQDNTDNDILAVLACSNGQVAKWNGSAWACAGDNDTDTTYTAGNGLTLVGTTFSANTSILQARVSTACGAGTYLKQINADGSIVCAADQDTVASLNCSSGQVAKWNGAAWTCASDNDTDTNTTYFAGSGLDLTDTTFSVDTTEIQARVDGVCGTGTYLQQINADGTVECALDANTLAALNCSNEQVAKWNGAAWTCSDDLNNTYEAGSGLYMTGNYFNVNSAAVQLRVSGSCGVGESIRLINSNGGVECETDDVGIGDITSVVGGTGLSGSAVSGEATLSLATSYRLPQTCAVDQIATWNGVVWNCDDDQDTLFSAGNGLNLSDTTFNVDTDEIQARVSSVCAAGFSIRAIAANGTVTCEEDDGAGAFSAGTGLNLSGGQFSLLTGFQLPQGCSNGQLPAWNGAAWICANDQGGGSGFWSLAGNSGLNPATAKLGTTDAVTLTVVVSNSLALRIQPGPWDSYYQTTYPSFVSGFISNTIGANVNASAIVAGGFATYPNQIFGDYSIIGAGTSNTISSGISSGILAGSSNTLNAYDSFIGAGTSNQAAGSYNAIGAGSYNQVSNQFNMIGAGLGNNIPGERSFIGAGDDNRIYGSSSFIGAGNSNVITNTNTTIYYSVIGSGYQNFIAADFAFIGGGQNNKITNTQGTVGGGYNNLVTGESATVVGGSSNTASGSGAFIGGGSGSSAGGTYATIPGGSGNMIYSEYATIGGGVTNSILGQAGTIAGGWSNLLTNSDAGFIGGGFGNSVISSTFGVIAGGGGYWPFEVNLVTDHYGAILGGSANVAGSDDGDPSNSPYATVVGGQDNTAGGNFSFVGGGTQNNANYYGAFIGGGAENTISGTLGTIAGGSANQASENSFIGGGIWNSTFSSIYSVIGGGGGQNEFDGNWVTDNYGAILGGRENTAGNNNLNPDDAEYAFVGGGESNTAAGPYTVVGGGWSNLASGDNSTVPGGDDNTASGSYSFAAGAHAEATHIGSFVWSAGGSGASSWGTNTFTVRASGGTRFYSALSGEANGVELSSGSGAWASLSDRNAKENFQAINPAEVLEKVANMDISAWSYKTEPGVTHIGPVAQDFQAAFNVGPNNTTITTVDADGVALAAIQGLYAEVVAENDSKDTQIAALETRLAALEAGQPAQPAAINQAVAGASPIMMILALVLALSLLAVAGALVFFGIQLNRNKSGSAA